MSKTTTDWDEIRRWAEAQGGQPARIEGTGSKGGDPGMLRLMFPNAPFAKDEQLQPIGWAEWLEAFDRNGLALVYEPSSRFNKIVARSTAEAREQGESGVSVHHPHGR
jgi:hypothetical protein